MRRIIITCLAGTAISLAVLAGSAAASGPAAPGKELLQITCGHDTFTISVPKGENARGAAQIVDRTGHLIPVNLEFSVVDVTTDTVLESGSNAFGGGHAHPNQAPTSCDVILFEGTAADFYGPQLPAGVGATDIIRASLAVGAIAKL